MLDSIRTGLHQLISANTEQKPRAVQASQAVAKRLNWVLGQPLCSAEELDRRRAAAARLRQSLGRSGGVAAAAPSPASAEVMVYFEKDRNVRELQRITELLDSRGHVYRLLDVSGDEATLDFVLREAKCKADDLPVAFAVGRALGGYASLVERDVAGTLASSLAARR